MLVGESRVEYRFVDVSECHRRARAPKARVQAHKRLGTFISFGRVDRELSSLDRFSERGGC